MHTSEFERQESQDAEFEAWSRLTTVTIFDKGKRPPADEMEEKGVILQDVQCFSSTSLLVESLIEQLCKLLETDRSRQKKLYHEICSKLYQMKLIDRTYLVEEFSFMRNHYQKALFQLLSVAKSTAIDPAESSSNALVKLSTSFRFSSIHRQEEHLSSSSRYHTEFEELEYIAKGAFGRVHKARNKLDGSVYAVKKICLRYHSIKSFLRSLNEVKMLAKLNHPNIVSYKAAWLEPFTPSDLCDRGEQSSQEDVASVPMEKSTRKSSEKPNVNSRSVEDSWCVEFKSSHSVGQCSSSRKQSKEDSACELDNLFHEEFERRSSSLGTSVKHGEASKTSDGTPSEDTEHKALYKYRSCGNVWKIEKSVSFRQYEWAMLYIQMQLCSQTLRHWLDQRNGLQRPSVDVKESLMIFQQIVLGVEYIHSQKIVHHDIKPSNIFVNEDLSQVQVGDFGLACRLQHSMSDVTFLTEGSGSGSQLHHKGEMGTPMYAAQEQLAGKCDPKSDIYSLGVVLFELLHPFSTDMERSKVVGQLKHGHIPPTITANSLSVAQLISVLVSTSTERRPTASDLVSTIAQLISQISSESSSTTMLVQRKDETIQELLGVIAQKDEEISLLKQRLQTLEAMNKT